jgi:ADP-ribosylglycohydrolase
MFGAVIGDIVGSVFEWKNCKSKDFPLFVEDSTFTDDSVLTFAVADAILTNKDYGRCLKRFGLAYPGRGYGGGFRRWLKSKDSHPYYSFGNGSAMRVSPVGFAFDTIEKVLEEAKKSAEPSHNHEEGIKGAQAAAAAIFMARTGKSKNEIRDYITQKFSYDLTRTVDSIRPSYSFNETCQGTVPEAITAFLESKDFEDAVRTAVSLGGDSDTLTCITGGIAQAYYRHIPDSIILETTQRLNPELLEILLQFNRKFGISTNL